MTPPDHAALARAVHATGLVPRGVVRLDPGERAGVLANQGALVLIGMVGQSGWADFTASPEYADRAANPLDRWSRRLIDGLARQFGATAVYPFRGPPHWPFQRWAQRAEPLHPSPLGLLIHHQHGLWHSYRGALAFAADWAGALPPALPSPCTGCARPCLAACPVGAFSDAGYDVAACAAALRGPDGADCMAGGCRARRACPVGADQTPGPGQAAFTMRAFLAARG